MPPPPLSTIMTRRKRTRSTNLAENSLDQPASTASVNVTSLPANTVTVSASPKRHRNNPPPVPPRSILPRPNYSLRNRSVTPGPRHASTRFPSLHTPASGSSIGQRYHLRPRHPQSQVRLPHVSTSNTTLATRRIRRPLPSVSPATTSTFIPTPALSPPSLPPALPPLPPPLLPPVLPTIVSSLTLPTPPIIQPRQYRLVYISEDDDDDEPRSTTQATVVNTAFNLMTEDGLIRPPVARRRASRSTSGAGLNTRLRTATAISVAMPSSATSTSSSSSSNSLASINSHDFVNGVAHVRLNRAIEIVIDSIQSLEGAVNNFDQLVFGLIYGRLGTRTEFETIEGMIRLSRILNLNLPSRLSQAEIDALPKIIFDKKPSLSSSILLVEKCPICLTEFDDQETINKLHCTHLFHLPCISTWLSENDSCPTCRRKVMGD